MRYIAAACDYDGTLAHEGVVTQETLAALKRLIASGRRLIIVTGRHLDDLLQVFPGAVMADTIVAENGAVIFRPHISQKKVLNSAPTERFIETLRVRGVNPSVGEVILSTWHPNENIVLETIRDMGLELQVIFNKGAVMVLPSGINKGVGLAMAARESGISLHNIVGIGDAENDHSFLHLCECSVAVSNALPELKREADLVTQESHGEGVIEIIDKLIGDDLSEAEPNLSRHRISLGQNQQGKEVSIRPYGVNILMVGPSASGKSTLASGFIERAGEKKYQYCVIDPEGDYETLEGVILGSKQSVPGVDEIIHLLKNPDENVIVYLIGIPVEERPAFLNRLLPELQELRLRTGHPHWVLIDEAHLFMPQGYNSYFTSLPKDASGFFFITVAPDQITASILPAVETLIVMGNTFGNNLRYFSGAVGNSLPDIEMRPMGQDDAIIWNWKIADISRVTLTPGYARHRRHVRQYADGDLGMDRSFYFRGPEGKLNLRAQNLSLFIQMAQGIDDGTWMYHLLRGDYSHWFKEVIKDDDLAAAAARIEALEDISPGESRNLIISAIKDRYIIPVSTT